MENDDFEDGDYSPASLREPSSARVETLRVPVAAAGMRLDRYLADALPACSRSRLAELAKVGMIAVNGAAAPPKRLLTGGETIVATLPPRDEETAFAPEDIPLRIVFEDAAVLVIDKPPGLVVHPAAGNWHGTLLNGLLARDPRAAAVPRAGIVHRLDKDTSGLMMVARTEAAQLALVRQLQARSVSRRYLALVAGQVAGDGTIREPIGRHPRQRIRMAVVAEDRGGKPAITHLRVLERLPFHTLLECRLETGRTHQIRVHLQWLGHPLAGDPVYATQTGAGAQPARLPAALQEAIQRFGRQALHATALAFDHPVSGERAQFEAPLPDDFRMLLDAARNANNG